MADEISFGKNIVRRVSNLGVYTLPANSYSFEKLTDADKKYCTRIDMNNDVVEIGEGFAKNAKFVRTVNVSENLKGIEKDAFSGCSRIKNIKLPKELEYIKENAFFETKINNISLGKRVKFIGENAFENCKKLKSFTIDPLNVEMTLIGENAFAGCKNLRPFELPQTIEEIGAGAFAGCRKIKSLTVPAECRLIDGNPFTSSSINKDNGKKRLRDRWHAYNAKIYIDGMHPNPIKARKFESMVTSFDGRRLIRANGQVYIENDKGGFDVKTPETYAKMVLEQQEEMTNTQISPEAFIAFTKQRFGVELDASRISEAQMKVFDTNKEVLNIALTSKLTQKINVEELREFAYGYQKSKECEELAKQRADQRSERAQQIYDQKKAQLDEIEHQKQLEEDKKRQAEANAREQAEIARQKKLDQINKEKEAKKQAKAEKEKKARERAEKKNSKNNGEVELPPHRKRAVDRARANQEKFEELKRLEREKAEREALVAATNTEAVVEQFPEQIVSEQPMMPNYNGQSTLTASADLGNNAEFFSGELDMGNQTTTTTTEREMGQ